MTCNRVRAVTWRDLQNFEQGWAKRALEESARGFADGLRQLMMGPAHLDEEPLYIAEYEYGQLVVSDGTFQPPCSDPVCESCQALVKAVRGTGSRRAGPTIPLTFVLRGCAEIFIKHPLEDESTPAAREEVANMLLPLTVIDAGGPFGVFETLDYRLGLPVEVPGWQVSAGVRSIYVIAPLDNDKVISGLTRRPGPGGKSIRHWELVSRTLAGQSSTWTARFLVLPRKVIESIRPDNSAFLHERLLEVGWRQSAALRMASTRDSTLLRNLRHSLQSQNLAVGELYYYFTLRHCFNILQGQRPSMVPLHRFRGEPGGPFESFRQRLAEELAKSRLDYEPVLLRPGMLGHNVPEVYYSIRIPSAPELETAVHKAGSPGQKPPVYKNVLSDMHRIIEKSGDKDLQQLFTERVRGFIHRPKKDGAKQNGWMLYADELGAEHFLGEGGSGNVFWNSPFFVAGLTLSGRR